MSKNLLDALIDLIYPPRRCCPLCGDNSPDASVCHGCNILLAAYAQSKICPVCGGFYLYGGSSYSGVSSSGAPYVRNYVCGDCTVGRAFDLARSVGPFEGPLREAVHRLKYHGMKRLAQTMGTLMVEAALREPAFSRSQALIPVPLSPGREHQRGYNQALLLARELERPLQAPVLEKVVVKMRETPAQTDLHRRERLLNLANSFAMRNQTAVQGKRIVIIDDVFTTGSTVSIISQLLRQAGATAITVLTFAGPRRTAKL